MKKCNKALIFLSILILSLLSAGHISQAAWSEPQPIRVGVFSLGNFQGFDENGEAVGYNIEYLKKIAELKHWRYEYVKVSNWVEATEYLEQGKIDLLAPAQNIPELNGRFSYAALPMGTEAAAVYALDDREDLFFEDFERMKTLRYGGAENSTFTKNFLSRAAQRGFEPDITYYKNTTELFDALHSKEVDAIVTNIMFNDQGIKIIDRFSPLPVYYISTNENALLLDMLYEAMCAVELGSPDFKTRLMAEYFPYFSNNVFTHSELSFIKEMPSIPVGYWQNGRPLSFTDEKTGEFAGITRDVLDRISEISGLTFEYVELNSPQITQGYLKEQGLFVLCGVEYNASYAENPNIWMSAPYFKSEKVLVGKEDLDYSSAGDLAMAADISSGALPDGLKNAFPDFHLQMYTSPDACFKAVSENKADILIQNRYVAEPYLSRPMYKNMKVLPVQNIDDNLCLAIIRQDSDTSELLPKLEDPRFLSIINKSIQRISGSEMNQIIIKHTLGDQYQYRLADFLYQYRYFLFTVSMFLVVCICGLIKIDRMKVRENRILSQAIEQANQASMAKSQFLSHMSHEIRTPLNAIVGMTALAKKTSGNPQKTVQYLEKITESSKLLMSIINDVLDMSAIESQKMKISEQTFDFKALLTSVSETYYAQCKQKNIRFEMLLDHVKREALIGDALRVNQVLLNLLSNAYKFTEPGGSITVTVTEMSGDAEKKKVYMRFSVKDTGCGISQEMQDRLFGAFEQESSITALKHGGSGLGLAITKNLVDLMHGAISVNSRPGEGTTFTVDLPFGTTDDVILADTKKLKELRVMVVDDDAYMRDYISSVLTGLGVRFDSAPSGEAALRLLEQEACDGQPYNVCFVDWQMPEMGGVEVVRRIRDKLPGNILTVIISAYDLTEVEDEARRAGVDLFISKPLFQSSVYNILTSIHDKFKTVASQREEDYDFTGKRALLAEDFELNREVAVDLLAMVNLETDCAEDGIQVVDMFLNSPPGTYDIIFMDIQMPEMDGYEAMRRIRSSSHSQAATIPIYAMTANAFAEDVARALSAGANGHIAKPIDSKALYALINKCIMEDNKT